MQVNTVHQMPSVASAILFLLPENIINSLISTWLKLSDLSSLDIGLVNHRFSFWTSFREVNDIFFFKDGEERDEAFEDGLFTWLISRKLWTNNITISTNRFHAWISAYERIMGDCISHSGVDYVEGDEFQSMRNLCSKLDSVCCILKDERDNPLFEKWVI